MSQLCNLALIVLEPDAGSFVWAIQEESEEESGTFPVVVDGSEGHYPTYDRALKAGVQALRALSPDPAKGPRSR